MSLLLPTARTALRFHHACLALSGPYVGLRMNYSHSVLRSPCYRTSWIMVKKRCLCTGGNSKGLRRNGKGGLNTHSLPEGKIWDNLVKMLLFRTNYSRDDLLNMWNQFRTIAGSKMYLTRSDFEEMMKKRYGMTEVETVDLYFRSFDTDHSRRIHYEQVREGVVSEWRKIG